MAASTRSGFAGGTRGGDGPTDTKSAPTLYGHDLHLDRAALDARAAGEEAAAPSRPITREEEVTAPAERPRTRSHHSGKSRFPALARLFGRWNTLGHLVEHRDHGRERVDELDEIPRERFLRPVAVVIATASISFFIVVGLLKLRDSASPAAPVAAPIAAPAPLAAAPVAPAPAAAPAPVAVAPLPARSPAVPAPETASARPSLARAVAAEAAARPATHRPARRPTRPSVPADPDSPLPLSF